MKLDDYMTAKQAAAECGLKYKTLLKRISVGTVPAEKLGEKIFIIKKTDVAVIKAAMAGAGE
ncbi:hypothetical protein STRZYGA_00440 [Brevundimonas phage vB_BpoS-Strzyga]|nr:hypothetical protein POLEWNIK_00800 [Brevundimonas phage vB_BpoS-Polewnik]USN16765.1 hypothetical protein STRZYGA_00440 [Brevundimonas phage vB_BpoS-Strzyga]